MKTLLALILVSLLAACGGGSDDDELLAGQSCIGGILYENGTPASVPGPTPGTQTLRTCG